MRPIKPSKRQEPRIHRPSGAVSNDGPQLRSPMAQIHARKEEASNIQPLGEVSAEKIERLFNQRPDPAPALKKDPAPSKRNYRFQRIWLSPVYRAMLRTGVPLLLLGAGLLYAITDTDIRAGFQSALNNANDSLHARPEFQIHLMKISGADDALGNHVRNELNLQMPLSSFEIDLNDLKERVELMDEIETANLYMRQDNVLEIELTPRVPVVLWRKADELELLDANGNPAGTIASRDERADLPLIAGAASEDYIAEAVTIFGILKPIGERVRGLRRIGERRWDVILDRYQTIQLPEEKPTLALRRVMALHSAQNLLDHDILRVDLRDPERLFVQMSPYATQIFKAKQSSN